MGLRRIDRKTAPIPNVATEVSPGTENIQALGSVFQGLADYANKKADLRAAKEGELQGIIEGQDPNVTIMGDLTVRGQARDAAAVRTAMANLQSQMMEDVDRLGEQHKNSPLQMRKAFVEYKRGIKKNLDPEVGQFVDLQFARIALPYIKGADDLEEKRVKDADLASAVRLFNSQSRTVERLARAVGKESSTTNISALAGAIEDHIETLQRYGPPTEEFPNRAGVLDPTDIETYRAEIMRTAGIERLRGQIDTYDTVEELTALKQRLREDLADAEGSMVETVGLVSKDVNGIIGEINSKIRDVEDKNKDIQDAIEADQKIADQKTKDVINNRVQANSISESELDGFGPRGSGLYTADQLLAKKKELREVRRQNRFSKQNVIRAISQLEKGGFDPQNADQRQQGDDLYDAYFESNSPVFEQDDAIQLRESLASSDPAEYLDSHLSVVSQWGYIPQRMASDINRGVISGSPEQRVKYSKILTSIANKYPNMSQSFSPEVDTSAIQITEAAKFLDPVEAVSYVEERNSKAKLEKELIENRLKYNLRVSEETGESIVDDAFNSEFSKIKRSRWGLDWLAIDKKLAQPTGMRDEFAALYALSYRISGDHEAALDYAKKKVHERYGATTIDAGGDRWQRNSLQSFYSNELRKNPNFLHQEMIQAIRGQKDETSGLSSVGYLVGQGETDFGLKGVTDEALFEGLTLGPGMITTGPDGKSARAAHIFYQGVPLMERIELPDGRVIERVMVFQPDA